MKRSSCMIGGLMMAEIKIVQEKYRCELGCDEFDTMCCTGAADDVECPYYVNGAEGRGYCGRVKSAYKYRGFSTKNYEVEDDFDPYFINPFMAKVITKKQTYYCCVRVEIDGECIFDETEEKEADKICAKR